MENIGTVRKNFSPEITLWAAVIQTAIQDATKNIREPDWANEWWVVGYRRKIVIRNKAREFFHNGSCTDILKSIGVEPEWFYRKLKTRFPEIWQPAMEGQG